MTRSENLLKAQHADTDGYRFDVCDLTRQVLSNYAKELYKSSIRAFDSKNIALFEKSVNAFVRLLEDVDRLLMTPPGADARRAREAGKRLRLHRQGQTEFRAQ